MRRRTFLSNLFALVMMIMLVMLPIVAKAADWSASYLFDIDSRRTIPVVTVDIGEIRRPLNFNYTLKVSTFAGVRDEQPLAGIWINAPWKLAENVDVKFGPAITYYNERVRTPGVMIGIAVRFQ